MFSFGANLISGLCWVSLYEMYITIYSWFGFDKAGLQEPICPLAEVVICI